MPTDLATLRTRRGEQAAARADLVRYGGGRRYGAAAASVAFGVVIGVASLPFPLIHFVLPWLFPLLGVVGALALLRVRGRISSVAGECPACRAPFEARDVGAMDGERLWLRCDACGQPLELVL